MTLKGVIAGLTRNLESAANHPAAARHPSRGGELLFYSPPVEGWLPLGRRGGQHQTLKRR